jgi:hypothetical protein
MLLWHNNKPNLIRQQELLYARRGAKLMKANSQSIPGVSRTMQCTFCWFVERVSYFYVQHSTRKGRWPLSWFAERVGLRVIEEQHFTGKGTPPFPSEMLILGGSLSLFVIQEQTAKGGVFSWFEEGVSYSRETLYWGKGQVAWFDRKGISQYIILGGCIIMESIVGFKQPIMGQSYHILQSNFFNTIILLLLLNLTWNV